MEEKTNIKQERRAQMTLFFTETAAKIKQEHKEAKVYKMVAKYNTQTKEPKKEEKYTGDTEKSRLL